MTEVSSSKQKLQTHKTPSEGGLRTCEDRVMLRAVTNAEPMVRTFCVYRNTPRFRPSRRTLSHGVETCPHARKVLFPPEVSPFLPGANLNGLASMQRLAGKPRKGTRVSLPGEEEAERGWDLPGEKPEQACDNCGRSIWEHEEPEYKCPTRKTS